MINEITELAKETYNTKEYKYEYYSDWKWFRKPHTIMKYRQTKNSINYAIDLINNFYSNKVMEIGIGDGVFTKILVDRGFDVTAVDVSEKMLRMARKRLGLAVNLILGDFIETETEKDYGLVFSIRCIEYIDDKPKLINKISEIGNKVIIITKNPSFIALKLQDRKLHSKQIKIKELIKLLEQNNFNKITIKPAMFGKGFHFPIWRSFLLYLHKKILNSNIKYNNFLIKPFTESYLVVAEK